MVRRSRAFDFCELFSMTLEPCEVGFQRLPAATHGGQQRASRTEQDRPRFASIINGVFGWEQFVLHALYLSRWALDESNFQATRHSACAWQCGARRARQQTGSTA